MSGPPPPSVGVVAAALGLDASGAEVVRDASRHVIRFPASRARTFAVPAFATSPYGEAEVAAVLAEAGVPAARCLDGPTEVDGWLVTAWREIEGIDPGAPEVGAAALGALAGGLHRATASIDPERVPPCDPLAAGRGQLDRAGGASAEDVRVLRQACDRLEEAWRRAVGRGDHAVLHGDLHRGNVVVGAEGPVLVDLELAGWGPRAFDAAPTVAFVRWYGRPEEDLEAFDLAYGDGLTAVARAGELDQVWALWSACWSVANAHRSTAAAEEAAVRVVTVATGRAPRPWRLR